MDRGPADVSLSGVLREAHQQLVFISKTVSENLDMQMDELIKEQNFSNASSILKLCDLEKHCNLSDTIYASTL